VRRFFRRGRLDDERAREMQAHLDHAVDDLIAAGYSRDRALKEARRRFGNPTVIRQEIYDMNSVPVLEPLVRDARYALRMLRKTPGFTAIALLTLALGIGANTAVFGVVNALMLNPLPYPRADRLGLLEYHSKSPRGDGGSAGADAQMYFTVRDHAPSMDIAIMGQTSGVNMLAGENQVAYVQQQRVGTGYFRVLGIQPLMGREFTREEDEPGGPSVTILSHRLWTKTFNSDRDIVGKSIQLRGTNYTVVGVMPASFEVTQSYSFEGGSGVDLWTPLRPSIKGEGGGLNYGAILRLHDGVDWNQARSELLPLSPQAFSLWKLKDNDVVLTLGIVPMQEGMTAELKRPLLMLWGGVGIVLLIACVNIAGLLLARGTTRTREIVTRLALGSGRAAVMRQLLVESAVLGVLGGAGGLAVGWGALALLKRAGMDSLGLWRPIDLDWKVMLITMTIALVTSAIFGFAPAFQASRLDVQARLSESGTRSVAGTASRWPRKVLVVSEVALAVVLLVSAGLLVRTFTYLLNRDPGFDTTNVVTASVSLQDARYTDPGRVNYLFDESLRRIRQIPGAQAGVALGLPYERLLNNGFSKAEDPKEKTTISNQSYVTPGYFEALRVPVRGGRLFTDADAADAPKVAIVNESFVKRYYRGEYPIGRSLRTGDTEREIVGIVGDTQQGSAGWGNFGPISPLPCIFIPAAQTSSGFLTLVHTWFQPSWAVRAPGTMASLLPQLEKAIQGVDAQLPIAKIRTVSQVRDGKLSEQRFMMSLVSGLGAIALVLAAIGIHGLIASSVSERTREFGIRLALGATSRQVLQGVVRPGLALALAGVVIGSVAALAAVRLLRTFLWGVRPTDPLTFALVIAGLLVVAFVATLIPALRILRLDPALTLRAE
jgi:predicted permease